MLTKRKSKEKKKKTDMKTMMELSGEEKKKDKRRQNREKHRKHTYAEKTGTSTHFRHANPDRHLGEAGRDEGVERDR